MSLLILARGGAPLIENDVRLSQPCTFWEQSIDLVSLTKRASALSGVRFAVDRKIGDLRVILFTGKQPLGQTLARVADCWDLAWECNRGRYRLFRTKEAEDAQSGFLTELRRDANAALDLQLDEWRKAPFVSTREGRQWMDRIDEAMARLREDPSIPKDGAARWDALYRAKEALRQLMMAADPPVLALAKAMKPDDVARLKAGEWVIGSTRAQPGFVRLPGTPADYDYCSDSCVAPEGDPYVGLRYDWLNETLTRWAPRLHPGDVGFELRLMRFLRDHVRPALSYRLADRLKSWVTNEDYQSWSPVTRFDTTDPAQCSPALYFERIARNMHIPVVATDLYESWGSGEDRASLHLSRALPQTGAGGGYSRYADGWLMVRSGDYWRGDAIAALAKLRGNRSPAFTMSALDELSDLAALRMAVPDDLLPLLEYEASRMPITSWLSHAHGERESYLLKIWSMLCGDQKRKALGDGLRWRDLSETQREAAGPTARALWVDDAKWNVASPERLPDPLGGECKGIRLFVYVQLGTLIAHSVGGGGTSWCVYPPSLPQYPKWIPDAVLQLDPDAELSAFAQWLFEFRVVVQGKSARMGWVMVDVPIWKGMVRQLIPDTRRLEGLLEPYWKAGKALAVRWTAGHREQ